jgi:formylglycine-generating enzyme required for sulfatase activity
VSSYKNYLPDDRLEGNAFRTLRGGAWYGNVIFVRCAYRYNDVPANRLSDVGFRVVSPGG